MLIPGNPFSNVGTVGCDRRKNSTDGAVLCNALWWNADVQGKQYGTNATDSAQCLKTTNVDTMNNNTKPHHKRASPMIVQAPWEDTLLTRGIGHPGFCNVEWPHVERFARSKIHASNSKQPKNRTREPLNIWISNRYPLDKHSSTRVYWLPRYSKRRQPHNLSLCDRTQWKRHARNPRSSCWRRPVVPECVECRAPRIGYPEMFPSPTKTSPEGIASN